MSTQQSDQPLSHLRVLVTRPDAAHDPLAERLESLGAEVFRQPAIRITPPDDWSAVDAAITRLGEFDWLVFSSANGVRFLVERIQQQRTMPTHLPKLAAIGPGTAEALERSGLSVALVPPQYCAESLADSFGHDLHGLRFLLARASRGREVLADQLTAAGATVEQIVVYASTDVERPDASIAAMLHHNQIDWITVTSSAIARSLLHLFGEDLRRTKLASMSPITSATLRELGYAPSAEAEEYTVNGLVAAIIAAETHGRDE